MSLRSRSLQVAKLMARNATRAAKDPLTAAKLVWRRLLPFGIVPKDAEAYRIGSWSYGRAKRVPLVEIFPTIEGVELSVTRAYDRDPSTSIDPSEVMALCAIIRHRASKRILEIGTFNGNTALNMALNAGADARVTTVDLPADWNGRYEIEVPPLFENVTDRAQIGAHYLAHPEAAGRIRQIFADSAKLDWAELGGPFDLIFIDGNHHYDYVRSDSRHALDQLAAGGVIVWHDYGMIEDVSRAVDELADRLIIHVVRGTRLAIGQRLGGAR